MTAWNATSCNDEPRRSAISVWAQAARVKSLLISTVSVFAGGAVAVYAGNFSVVPFVLAWLGAVAVQAGTNLTNVYFNYKSATAAFQPDPHGSAAAVQQGWLTPAQVRVGSLLCFGTSLVVGLFLTWMRGFAIMLIGITGAAA